MIQKTLIPIGVVLATVVLALIIVKNKLVRGPQIKSQQGIPLQSTVPIKKGVKLQDFQLVRHQGSPILFSQLSAKVTLINFWASWCEACMVELPSIIKLREKFQTRGFDVALVNLDEHPDKVLPTILKRLKIDFPIYLDPESKLGSFFNVHAIPLTVVLSKGGEVLFHHSGEYDWSSPKIHKLAEEWLMP